MEGDFRHECVDIAVEHGMCGEYMRLRDQPRAGSGLLPSDPPSQGPEFTSCAFLTWHAAQGVRHLRNDANCSTHNAYTKSSKCKFRDESLNQQWFESLAQARQEIARWTRDYSEGQHTVIRGLYRRPASPHSTANALARLCDHRRSSSLQNRRPANSTLTRLTGGTSLVRHFAVIRVLSAEGQQPLPSTPSRAKCTGLQLPPQSRSTSLRNPRAGPHLMPTRDCALAAQVARNSWLMRASAAARSQKVEARA